MVDLKDLLKAGVHFGHKSSRWSPKMRPFIWGSKNKVHLIDIAKTAFLLERAGKFLKNLISNGKSILWIGTKKPAQEKIKNIALSLKMPFVINRWIGGTLTNFNQVKKAITHLLYLRDIIKKPSVHYKKKELSMLQKEVYRLEKNIGGIIDLEYPPGAIVLVDAKKERSAIKEAINANIPIIAQVDTNTDPSGINLIVPANDDSPRSISFIMDYLCKCAQDGKQIYNERKKEELEAKQIAKKEKAKTKVMAKPIKKETPLKKPIIKKVEKPTAKPVKKTEVKTTKEVKSKASVVKTAKEIKTKTAKETPSKEISKKAPVMQQKKDI
ncbi:30S ribosomal protein S2 [Candidatus Dependentiae bacterium]